MTRTPKVIVTGPAPVRELADVLGVPASELPAGMPGTPVVGLVRALAARGVPVTLVTCSPEVTEELVMEAGGMRLRVGPYRGRHRARDAFRTERAYVAGAVDAEGPGVAHAHWTYEFALGALASGLPTVVTVRDWGPAILRYHPHPYRVVRLGMQLAVLRRAPTVTVTSPYMAERVRRITRSDPVLIPNAIEEDVVAPRPSFSLSAARPLLLAVNNGWGRRKNVDVLLRAFALVRAVLPGAGLELVGAGYGPGEVAERWAVGEGLAGGVRFRGSVSAAEVRARMARADVFVHPSREESFGLVLVEAMAQGTPVVGGRCSGAVPWVLDGGGAGVLTDVAGPEAIARTVLDLLGDAEGAGQLARRGYERARSEFTISAVAARYLALYEAVA